jgi:hypothetical protein
MSEERTIITIDVFEDSFQVHDHKQSICGLQNKMELLDALDELLYTDYDPLVQ